MKILKVREKWEIIVKMRIHEHWEQNEPSFFPSSGLFCRFRIGLFENIVGE